jgi:hypothetical protein
MNILWVEDFGANLPCKSTTLLSYFKTIEEESFFDPWDDDEVEELLEKPQNLEIHFRKHSRKNVVTLLLNYFHFEHYCSKINLSKQIDLAIIDINLSERLDFIPDKSIKIPPGFSEKDFHENAGLFIYNRLVAAGIPTDNICFVTAEEERSKKFENACRNAYLPDPLSFTKRKNYEELRLWLETKKANSFLTFKRSVINGCEFLIQNHSSKPDNLLKFLKAADPVRDDFSRENVVSFLETFIHLLPGKEPAQDEKQKLYKILARSMAHEWEAAHPGNLMENFKIGTNNPHFKYLRSFGWVLKNLRNWLAHGKNLSIFAEKDLAFFFLLNMRSIFELNDCLENYEEQLLTLFQDKRTPAKIDFPQLQKNLMKTFDDLKTLLQTKNLPESLDAKYFNEIAKRLHSNDVILPAGLTYLMVLYQMFWQGLIDPKNGFKLDPGIFQKIPFLSEFCRHFFLPSFGE